MGSLTATLRLALVATLAAMLCAASRGRAQSTAEFPAVSPTYLEAWVQHCDSFLGNIPGTVENYPALIRAARAGLAICPPAEENYTSRFLYLLAAGHEFTGSPDSAIHYYKACERICLRLRDTAELARVSIRLRTLYVETGNNAAATAMINRVMYIDRVTGDTALREETAMALSKYYFESGAYEKTLTYCLAQIERHRRQGMHTPRDSTNNGVLLARIGEVEMMLNHFPQALGYFHESRHYLRSYEIGAVHVLKNLVNTHLGLGNTDSALFFFADMQRMAAGKPAHREEIAYTAMTLASYYHDAGEMAQADAMARRALALAQSGCNQYCRMQAHYMMGRVALTRKQYAAALQHLIPALEVAAGGDAEWEMDLRQMAAEAYAGIGEYQQAYEQQRHYAVLNDTLTAQKTRRTLAEVTTEMDTKYQTAAREQRIALLNKNNALQATALSATRRQRLLAIAGLLLLAGLATTLTIGYRNKQRTAAILDQKNQQLGILNKDLDAANQTKARLFGIISHDLRAPVSQLYQFIRLQQDNPGLLSPEAAARHSRQISEGAANLLDTMEDILLWSKSQMDGFRPILTPVKPAAVAEAVVSLLRPLAESRSIAVEGAFAGSLVIQSDGNILHLILRNLVQNAIQHSPAGGRVLLTTGAHWIDIVDNAPPLPAHLVTMLEHAGTEAATPPEISSGGSGLGLQLVAELAPKLGIAIKVLNTGNGQSQKTIRVAFPV